MKPTRFMLIAGEASGDLLAAELAMALRERVPDATFFGAGGPKMAAGGVELVHEMSNLALVGVTDVIGKLFQLRRLMRLLLDTALKRQPDAIIGVDYGGFNLRFGHAVKEHVRNNPFSKWSPRLVQFVSPQVWASRPGRAKQIADDYDLLLSIFPFEKDWYAKRVPKLRVEFVGHPMVGRFNEDRSPFPPRDSSNLAHGRPQIVLLPGSRKTELRRHLPPMLDALKLILEKFPAATSTMVLPREHLLPIVFWNFAQKLPVAFRRTGPANAEQTTLLARQFIPNLTIQIGRLEDALAGADIALAKTGTVTMECAFFGVPAVTFYKSTWLNYKLAMYLITVDSFTMPNLLANEQVYPELIQQNLTAENLSRHALDLLQNEGHRAKIKSRLARVISSLGPPGAPARAAQAIVNLLNAPSSSSSKS